MNEVVTNTYTYTNAIKTTKSNISGIICFLDVLNYSVLILTH